MCARPLCVAAGLSYSPHSEISERSKELLAKRAHFLHKGTASLPADEIFYRGAHDWKPEKVASLIKTLSAPYDAAANSWGRRRRLPRLDDSYNRWLPPSEQRLAHWLVRAHYKSSPTLSTIFDVWCGDPNHLMKLPPIGHWKSCEHRRHLVRRGIMWNQGNWQVFSVARRRVSRVRA